MEILLFTYLIAFAYGAYIYKAYDADLQISFQKSLLLGFSQVEGIDDDNKEYVVFQLALLFAVFTFSYDAKI